MKKEKRMEKRISILLILLLVLIAGIIILAVFDLIDWSSPITLGGVLEILTLIILVFITAMYALSASEQADASVKMAKYMVKPRLIPDLYLVNLDGEGRVFFNATIHNDGEGPAYDIELWIEDDSTPASKLITHAKKAVLRQEDYFEWRDPTPYLDFPHSDSVQRRFFVIKYRDFDGEYEIRLPFVLTTVGDDKPYARLESISRKMIRQINLEDELP